MRKQTFSWMIMTVLFISATISQKAFSQKQAKANRDTKNWRYEIECAGIGNEGTYMIKVWSYSKRASIATNQAKKNAVHGVIFQGFAGGGQGCTSQRPLASSPSVEDEHAEFFDDFFADGGKYMKYVGSANDGAGSDVVKVGKEYKVGVIVSVLKDNLRKDLEAAGIIKRLDSGF